MNTTAVARAIWEAAKYWLIKIDRLNSKFGGPLDLMLVDERRQDFMDPLRLGASVNAMPVEFILSELFSNPDFQAAIRTGLKGITDGKVFDVLDRMFYNSFCVIRVMTDAPENTTFQNLCTNNIVFIIGSPANGVSLEISPSAGYRFEEFFSNAFCEQLRQSAAS